MTIPMQPANPSRVIYDLGTWLLPEADPIASAAAQRALEQPNGASVLSKLGRAAKSSVAHQVVAALRTVLRDDLVDLLLKGWAKHRSLVQAAVATASQPDADRTVLLAEHRVVFDQEPTVDIVIDQLSLLLTLHGRVTVTFDVGRVDAVVRGGRLVQLNGGHTTITGLLRLEGQELANRRRDFRADLTVRLGTGIDLTRGVPLWTAGALGRAAPETAGPR